MKANGDAQWAVLTLEGQPVGWFVHNRDGAADGLWGHSPGTSFLGQCCLPGISVRNHDPHWPHQGRQAGVEEPTSRALGALGGQVRTLWL